jgi:3-oxoacyl-[acyl-carrier-protein] synthase-3
VTYVDSLSSALGEQTFTVEEAAARGWLVSSPAHFREAGFAFQRVCRPETTAYDLARKAVERIRSQLTGVHAVLYHSALPINSNLGDMTVFAQTGEIRHLTDFPVSHLQADFDLKDAFVFGITQQACTGILGAIRIARAMLSLEPQIEKILCVTSDKVPVGAKHESTYNPLADGAVACIVSRNPSGFRVLAQHQVTNGAMSLVSPDEVVGSYFSYSHKMIQETLAAANLRMGDIHWIIPQNTTKAAWQIFCSLLRFDYERVLTPTMAEVGHLVSGCNLVNLIRCLEDGRIAKGERVLLPMAGYGLNWQCILLEKV